MRWQTMRFEGQLLGLRIEEAGSQVRVGVWTDAGAPEPFLAALAEKLAWRANLRLDLADFERRARRDRELAPVVGSRSSVRSRSAIARGGCSRSAPPSPRARSTQGALREATVDEQREALLSIYGVGPASVGYILVDVFHAFDELSHISPWEQGIYSRLLLGLPVDDAAPVPVLLERIARWSPWRALAVHYLWEDLFWRHHAEPIDWLAPLIRL